MEQTRKPTHPGKVFYEDVLVPLELTVTQAAVIMGITRKALSEFVNERSACSPLMAIRLAAATGTSAESWLSMQTKLDLWNARRLMPAKLRRFPKVAV